MSFIAEYQSVVLVFGLTGALIFLQLLVADIIGIVKKHKPGHDITSDHDNLLFRVNRAFLNSNESVAIFILVTIFAVLSSATPYWVNLFTWVYFASRVAHMICYYVNWKVARSVVFAGTAVSLIALFVLGVMAY